MLVPSRAAAEAGTADALLALAAPTPSGTPLLAAPQQTAVQTVVTPVHVATMQAGKAAFTYVLEKESAKEN